MSLRTKSNNLNSDKMKTFIDGLIEQFVAVAHPAGGWFKLTATQKKRSSNKGVPVMALSPDCFNVRGGSSKKSNTRRTPAP